MSYDLSIVIVNWNVKDLLRRCLSSLQAGARGDLDAEMIVVDNASSDGSAEMVVRDFPQVRLLANETNAGFTRGANQGLRESTGRHILLLNPDTEIVGDILPKMIRFMDEHPKVGVIGPRLVGLDGHLQDSRRRFPTLATAFFESTILEQWFPQHKLIRRFYVQDRAEDSVQEVDWLVGACLLARREAIADVGLLDEDFFMYSEEVDWCRRMKIQGWRVAYFPAAQVIHLEGQSSRQELARRDINFHSSRAHFFAKHHGATAGLTLRSFVLLTFAYRFFEEGVKLALGHKRELRRQRLSLIGEVLRSRLASPARRVACSPVEQLDGDPSGGGLRVAFITGEFPPLRGGVGDYTDQLAHHLSQLGVVATVITSARVGPLPKTADRGDGVQVLRQIEDWGWDSWRKIRPILRREPADVVHIQYQAGAYRLHPAVNLLPLWLHLLSPRPKLVTTFHDLRVPYIFPKVGPLRRRANLALARLSDLVIVTNEEDYQALQGRIRGKLELIPISSNIPVAPPRGFQPAAWRDRLGLSPEQTLLAYFGFLSASKGIEVLLDALSILLQREGPGRYRLVMIGGGVGETDLTGETYREGLQRRIERLGLADAMIWTDYTNPAGVSAALLSAHLGVFPFLDGASFRRGSLLAALSHGLPVVTTQPSFAEAGAPGGSGPRLVDGLNARLVAAGRPEPLAEAISQLATDADLRNRLAEGAEELAKSFRWPEIAQQTALVYRQVAGAGLLSVEPRL